jgi:lon-related putative ATP-dependent protease
MKEMKKKTLSHPLPSEALYTTCDFDGFSFNTTDELEKIDVVIGQERAFDALDFGIRIKSDGYNLFALGPSGTGRFTAVRQIVARTAAEQPPAPDWCYINNFIESHKPTALLLPPWRGILFKKDVEQFIEEAKVVIPATFDGDEYRSRAEEIEEELKDRHAAPLNELSEEAKKQDIALIKTATGFAFAPLGKKEEVLSPEEFNALPNGTKKEIQEKIANLHEKLKHVLSQFPAWRKETNEKLKALDHETGRSSISNLIESLKSGYQDFPHVIEYIKMIEQDILKNLSDFRGSHDEAALSIFGTVPKTDTFRRYSVNVLVDNSGQESAPIVFENHPNHANLIGRSEYQSYMGALVTDFTLIKPGALHRANGGYLVLDVRKVLMQPYAWESLKRTLETGEIRIESLERTLSLISTIALEPEPIPLNVKVILVGDRILYYLLLQYDPDFQDLFKVAADFDDQIARNEENNVLYARMIGSLAGAEGLRHLEKDAVARLIEYCARVAGDAEKLSTHLRSITDLMREADHWAEKSSHAHITAADIIQAINKQIYRSARIQQRINEEIQRGTILIDTTGSVTAQVNGLSIIQLGNHSFGRPSRITATTRFGDGEVLDIERETELGGPLHSKGVMILSSFLASRYARENPLSMTASIVFEQSYGEVEGDSASVAELCALLSALSDLPINQSLALTGSINQHGKIQAIGGVNEKIEGFFDVCKTLGLNGAEGVLIPESNVKHLMLRKDVVDAAAAGRFNIYAVRTIDEAMELLTGVQAGVRDKHGVFPAKSVNRRVEDRLLEYASIRRRFIPGAGKQSETGNE